MKFYRLFVKIWYVICLITKHIDSRNFTQHKMKRNQLQLAGLTKLLTRILAISSHLAVDEIARPVPRNCFSVKVLAIIRGFYKINCDYTEEFSNDLANQSVVRSSQVGASSSYFAIKP